MMRAAIVAIGLILWALPPLAHADDFARCAEEGYLAHFDERLSPQMCEEITTAEIHWRGGRALLRAVHPRDTAMTDSAVFVGRIHELAAEVGAAMDRMGGDLRLDDVTLVFTNYASPREEGPDEGFDEGAYRAGASALFANECPVTYYKGTRRSPGDEFSFILAHEIFHCIQFRTWADMPEEDWLTEGSAEYFAFLVRPSYRGEAAFIAAFDNQIPGVPLRDLNYSAVVFFLWLGDVYGPARVHEFVASARSMEAAIPPDMWIDFGQAYFDRNIHLPDGATLSLTPQVGGTRAIHGDDRLRMPAATPYTLNNAIFDFDEAKIYDLTYAASSPDVRMRWRKVDGGAWEPPLTLVSTCDGDQLYRVIWASTAGTSVGDIEVRAQPEAVCTCPAGIWQETTESLRRMMEQSALPGPSRTTFVSGGRLLRLNGDHTGSFTYQDVVTETHSSAEVWLRQTKTGGSHFTWTIVTGDLLTVLTPGDNLLTLHNEQHSPSGIRVVTRRAGAQSIGHAFRCDETGLHLRQESIPGMSRYSVDMDFVRVADATPPTR